MLKTNVTFTNKTIQKTKNKSKLALDYRTMDTNIDEIRCLDAVLLFRGVYHDTKQILGDLWYSLFSSRIFYQVVLTLNATNG